MLLAHISDLHVMIEGNLAYGIVDTGPMVEKAIAHIKSLSPDAVVISGDLVHEVKIDEYERLKEMLSVLEMPVFLMTGNHDSRDFIRQVFANYDYLPAQGFLHYTVEDYPVRLIMLDTNVLGEGRGALDSARLQWLDSQLAAQPDRPTLIFMHHPPFSTGIKMMDGLGRTGADELAEIVRKYDCVERVGCGHLHRPIQKRWAGTLAYTVPSPVHQVSLDLVSDSDYSSFVMEPPAYQLHLWREGEGRESAGLVSHVQYINSYDGPYTFR